MTDATIISMQDLPAATVPADTDTFAVCQNPNGCGPTDPLSRMTLAELAAAIIAKIPAAAGPQYASRIVPYAQRVPLQSGIVADIAAVDLPVGDWLVWGETWFVVDSGAPQILRAAASLSPTSQLSSPTDPADGVALTAIEPQQSKQSGGASTGIVLPFAPLFVSVTAPLTYFLSCRIDWTATGTVAAYGKVAGFLQPATEGLR